MKLKLTFLFLFMHVLAISQYRNIYIKLGSTGIGAGYEQKINAKWQATASLSYMNVSPSILLKGSSMQHRLRGTAKFTQLELAAKWYPNAKSTSYGITNSNKFFLKGGLLIRDNGNYLLISDYQVIKPNNQFDANDPASGRLNFNLITNMLQPIVTTGFELIDQDSRWSANIEAGLSYHGTSPTIPFVNYFETGANKLYEPRFSNWVRVPKLIRLVKVYPLLNFTIGRRF